MTREEAAASKAAQDREAAARQRENPTKEAPAVRDHVTIVGDAADPVSGIEDHQPARQPNQAERPTEPAAAKPPPVSLTKGDGKRSEIMGRYRAERKVDDDAAKANAEDLDAFTHGGLPPEMVADPDAAADAEEIQRYAEDNREPDDEAPPQEPTQQERPPRHTLRVHGRDVDLSMDEIIAAAQKSLAADNLLEEAKQQSREAAELLRQARGRVAAPGQHQTETSDQQPPEPAPVDQGPDLADVVETLQIGGAEDGAQKLAAYIDHRIAEVRKEAAIQPQRALADQRVAEELDRSNRAIATFKKANPALFDGKAAEYIEIAIEKKLYDKYREDLEQNGITNEAMQQQLGREPNVNDLARYHTWYRGNRPDVVRTMDRLLEDAKTTVLEDNPAWKVTAAPAPATPRKVEVEVDRSGRRQAIQRQPSRAAAPAVPAPRGAPQIDRSAVAQKMIAERAAKRGRAPLGT